MAGNIFINNDPTLSPRDFSTPMDEIERMERDAAERMQRIQQFKSQVQMQQHQPQKSATPVWDEIDKLMQSMTDKEFDIVTNNDEWVESNNQILALIQQAQLQMLRPIIEQSKEGKDALDNHLTITKRIKKSASKVVDDELSDFQEYKSRYSHLPYEEYLKMKNNPTTTKSKKQ